MSLLVPLLLHSAALAQDAPAAEAPAAEAPAAEVGAAITYALDPVGSLLYVRTFKDTSLTHDHAVHATGWSGTVTWHPEDASQCEVEITVPVSGLVVDDSSVRLAAGITADAPSQSDRETIRDTMLGGDQLDASSFPQVRFVATACSGTSGAVNVTGDLTVHGVTRSVTAAMEVAADAASFTASGALDARHSDFGIEPFTFLLGAFANGQALQFGINVRGTPE